VGSLKQVLAQESGIPKENQMLILDGGRELDNDANLEQVREKRRDRRRLFVGE
jgi:hypothetical protein